MRVADGCGLQQRRILKRVLFPDAIEQTIVEDTEATADRSDAPTVEVIREPDPWTEVGVLIRVHVIAEWRTGDLWCDCLSCAARRALWEDNPVRVGCRNER